MSYLSIAVLALPALTGFLFLRLLRLEKRKPTDTLLELSWGIGIGLGFSSLLYFLYLHLFAGLRYFLYIELGILFILLTILLIKRKPSQASPPRSSYSVIQIVCMIAAAFVCAAFLIAVTQYTRQRARGDWDAWMIYNRTARFIYYDQAFWMESFSEEMHVIFHADYPLLLPLNIASGWDILGQETAFIPMLQSLFFSFASISLLFGALARLKTVGQASLGVILLGGVSLVLAEAGRQTADVPLAYYMLACVSLIAVYTVEKQPALMVAAGFSAGLAAWTKNEGSLFMLVVTVVLAAASIQVRSGKMFKLYAAGLLFPLIILLYFKIRLAPATEFIGGGPGSMMQNLLSADRHQIIVRSIADYLWQSGGWVGIGIFPILCIYFWVFHSIPRNVRMLSVIGFLVITCQVVGYYLIYLITPYDLKWHLDYSLGRLFVQIYPVILLLILNASVTPETVFGGDRDRKNKLPPNESLEIGEA